MRTPETIAKLQEARRLLRLGSTSKTITDRLGLTSGDVATQRRLMRLTNDPAREIVKPRPPGLYKRAAAENGDLVDIFNARPSRKDWGVAEGRD